MEQKLLKAAASLPAPRLRFDAIAAEAQSRTSSRPRFHFRRAAALAAALMLVFTFTAAGYRYNQIQRSMWVLHYQRDWEEAQNAIGVFSLTLPEMLNGYDFVHQQDLSVVPRGTPLAQAMLTEFYRPISVAYGHFATSEHSLPDSVPEIDEWGPSLNIGSTDSPYWQTYFSIGEDGLVSHEHVVPGSLQVISCGGTAVQLYQTRYSHTDGTVSGPYAHALWVDDERGCCILLALESADLGLAMDTVRQLMALNP